jgi:ribosomal protein S18 acetylase RimI-like enzyme
MDHLFHFTGSANILINEMSTDPNIKIRPASADDKDFITAQMHRLTGFGPPPWRDPQQMYATDIKVILDHLAGQADGTAIFIAEDADGTPLGFVHLRMGADHYNKEEHGHIEDLVVAAEGEGRGIGRALMSRGEEWARSRGYRWLTLSVFAQNQRAKTLYERLGYGEDMMRYVKEL